MTVSVTDMVQDASDRPLLCVESMADFLDLDDFQMVGLNVNVS